MEEVIGSVELNGICIVYGRRRGVFAMRYALHAMQN